jgi:hypothetical protein
MHESFRLDETVPVPPGTSPFNLRGVSYARVLEDAKTLPGGVDRFLDELVDHRVRDFMRQKFQFMTWYDALPLLPCAVTMTRINDRPLEAHMRAKGRESMRKLIPSMFRILSRLGGPRLAASHAPRLFQTYFDFLEFRLTYVNDDGGSGTISGVPLYLAPVVLNLSIGFINGALESLGAMDIGASYRDLTVSGSRGGFDLVTCHSDFKWRLAPMLWRARP